MAGDGSIRSLGNVHSRVLRASTETSKTPNRDNSALVTSSGPHNGFRGRGYSPSYSRVVVVMVLPLQLSLVLVVVVVIHLVVKALVMVLVLFTVHILEGTIIL